MFLLILQIPNVLSQNSTCIKTSCIKFLSMCSFSQIVKESVSFVNEQLNEDYSRNMIESQLRWKPQHLIENDVMPQIISSWKVSLNKYYLIKCVHHDWATYAFKLNSLIELEKELAGKMFYLNPFATFVIPIFDGKVQRFNIYDKSGNKIIKEDVLDFPEDDYSQYEIEWLG